MKPKIKKYYRLAALTVAVITMLSVLSLSAVATTDLSEMKAKVLEVIDSEHTDALADAGALGYIPDDQRDELVSYIDKLRDAAKKALNSANNTESVEAVNRAALNVFDDAIAKARIKDKTARLEQVDTAVSALDKACEKAIKDIDSTLYLNDGEKDVIKATLRNESVTSRYSINAAPSTAEINRLLEEGIKKLDEICAKASTDDVSKKTALIDSAKKAIDERQKDALSKISALENISDEQKKSLTDQVETAVSGALADVENANSTSDIDNSVGGAVDKIDGICADAEKFELEEAKKSAIRQLEEQQKKYNDSVDALKGISKTERQKLKDDMAENVNEAKDRINASESTEAAKSAWKNLSFGVVSQSEGKNTALVVTMLILFVIGLAEAVTVFLLIKEKKSPALASFAPLFPSGLLAKSATASLMWVAIILLAIADIAMAAYIVYLVRWISERKKAKAEEMAKKQQRKKVMQADSRKKPAPVKKPAPAPRKSEKPSKTEEKKHRRPKINEAAINIDTLGEIFNNGDTVTLAILKEKGLVDQNAECLKVLGRGEIKKALVIKAREFSSQAVKKITAAGGKAVISEEYLI